MALHVLDLKHYVKILHNVNVYAFLGQRVEELEDALKKKDDDMKQMEERYKKYLEKAKSVSPFLFQMVIL